MACRPLMAVLEAGAASRDITPPLPVDLLGYVRRDRAPRSRGRRPLLATACVLRSGGQAVVLLAADLAGVGVDFSDDVRDRVARAVGCSANDVLFNVSHSHAAPWPGARWKLGGEFDDWTETERAYVAWLPAALASTALEAAERSVAARIAGGVGSVRGWAVNRRERTADGRTILGWNPDGFIDESIPSLRIDGPPGRTVATVVGFGCHPVVVGPDDASPSPDFVGPLRERVEALRGGVCLFLQGAAGNVLPLEAFQSHAGAEDAMGERLGLEAAHAVADAEPYERATERLDWGSVTPIGLYRRRVADSQPEQRLASASRRVDLPLLEPPDVAELERELRDRQLDLERRLRASETRATTNPVRYHIQWLEATLAGARERRLPDSIEGEIWAARLGDHAVVGAPGEIFGEIGHAVRERSPAAVTLFAGYSNGVLGYVATPDEYPHGGYEPAVSHRGYGPPAPFSPVVAGIIERTALELLGELFPAGSRDG